MTRLVGHHGHLEIAGLKFHVTSAPLPLAVPEEPFYREFLSPSPATPPGSSIAVRVLRAEVPSPREGSAVFESGSTWRLYAGGGNKTVVHGSPGREGGPLWAAEMAAGGREVTVTCGAGMERTVAGTPAVENPLRYPLDQILVMLLLGGEGVICHASGAVRNGRAVVLAGVSGAGKTTVSRRLQAAGGYHLLSDDRVIVRRDGERFVVYGTPWPGEGGFASSAHAPLEHLCMLRKGDTDATRELAAREALERLLPALSLPWFDREALDGPLAFLDDLLRKVPILEVTFTHNESGTDLFFPENKPAPFG